MCNPKTTTEAWGRCYLNYRGVIAVCQGIQGQNFKTHLYMLSQMCQFSKKKLLHIVRSEQRRPSRNNTKMINGIMHPVGYSKRQFLLIMSILKPTLLSATKVGYGCCIADSWKIVSTSCTFAIKSPEIVRFQDFFSWFSNQMVRIKFLQIGKNCLTHNRLAPSVQSSIFQNTMSTKS